MNSIVFAFLVFVSSVLSLPSRRYLSPTASKMYTPASATGVMKNIVTDIFNETLNLNGANQLHLTVLNRRLTTTDFTDFARPTTYMLGQAFSLSEGLHSIGLYHRYDALDKNYGTGTKAKVDSFQQSNNVFYRSLLNLMSFFDSIDPNRVLTSADDNNMEDANVLCAIGEHFPMPISG